MKTISRTIAITFIIAQSTVAMNPPPSNDFDFGPLRNLSSHDIWILSAAAETNDFDAIRQIIDKATPKRMPETPDKFSEYEYSIDRALSFSTYHEQPELLDRLLTHYPAALQIFKKSDCLWKATLTGKLPLVQLVLEKGAPIEGGVRLNPLIEATKQGHIRIVQYLIEQGANLRPKFFTCEEFPLCVALRANNCRTACAILASIAKAEREKLETAACAIRLGLAAVNRGIPTPPRDVRKFIAQMVITSLVDEHMAYAEQLVSDVPHGPKLSSFADIRNEVATSIRRILFSKSALSE